MQTPADQGPPDGVLFGGVALAYDAMPRELVERHGLHGRVHDRGGAREVRFLARDHERLLPVRLDGRLQVVRWGCRRGQSRALPCTAWASVATLQGGGWGDREVLPVVIPATMGVARGVWFPVRAGVRGIVVHDERGQPVAYVLVEPSTHYYKIMTRSGWMPALVGESI
jgi:hypothetical protein